MQLADRAAALQSISSYLCTQRAHDDLLAVCCHWALVRCCCAVLEAEGLAAATPEGQEVQLTAVWEGTVLLWVLDSHTQQQERQHQEGGWV